MTGLKRLPGCNMNVPAEKSGNIHRRWDDDDGNAGPVYSFMKSVTTSWKFQKYKH
jgi:hypothetical protein